MTQRLALLILPLAWAALAPADDTPAQAAAKIKAADGPDRARAWRYLVDVGPAALPQILEAFDDASPLAANYLRAAVDAIAEKAVKAGQPLPVKEMEAFLVETKHNGKARRLAYEWLVQIDAAAPDRYLPGMLNDPSVELRRDAIARVLGEAEKAATPDARIAAYRKALQAARDKDQVDLCAKQLKDLGQAVDLVAHFGFITRWHLIGPFDSTEGKGFAAVYPPENGVDLGATYPGKKDAALKWIDHATSHPYGEVDLNKAIGKHMGAAGYAFAAVSVPKETPVEIRLGSNNSVKVWLNGRLLLQHEEYHHGTYLDQYAARGTLKAGRNELLIKVCQNEQKDDWAQSWAFQARICDAVGTAVPVTVAGTGTEAK
jgi:hypothetical protein